MRINPEQGSIEVGNIIYSKTLKKTRGYRNSIFVSEICVRNVRLQTI